MHPVFAWGEVDLETLVQVAMRIGYMLKEKQHMTASKPTESPYISVYQVINVAIGLRGGLWSYILPAESKLNTQS